MEKLLHNIIKVMFIFIFTLSCAYANKLDAEKAQKNCELDYLIDIKISKLLNIHIGQKKESFLNHDFDYEIVEFHTSGGVEEVFRYNIESNILELSFDASDRLYRISTTSASFKDAYGNGVGTSLETIKKSYPEGVFIIGEEGRRFANFITPGYVMFVLDDRDFQDGCFKFPKNCLYDGNTKFVAEINVLDSDASEYIKNNFKGKKDIHKNLSNK